MYIGHIYLPPASVCHPVSLSTSLSSFNLFTFPIDNPQIHLMLFFCTKEYNRPQGREQAASSHVLPSSVIGFQSPLQRRWGFGSCSPSLLEFWMVWSCSGLMRQQQLLRTDVCNSHITARSWRYTALRPIHQRNYFRPFCQVSRVLGGGKVDTDGIRIWSCGAISTQHLKQSWVSVLATITVERSSLTEVETSQYVQL